MSLNIIKNEDWPVGTFERINWNLFCVSEIPKAI